MDVPPEPERPPFEPTGLDLDEVRGLFEALASTSLGARAVRELSPLPEAEARSARARVREAQGLERAGDLPSLGGVTDLRPAWEAVRAFRRPLERGELASLVAFLDAARRLREWLEGRRAELPALAELVDGLPGLTALERSLEKAVDSRGELRDEASPRLARLRTDARALDGRIGEAITRLAASAALRSSLTDFKVHRRGGRRVLAVKAKSAGRVPGIQHERSGSGETVFVEPREVLELANRLADVEQAARAEEARLLIELTQAFLEHADSVMAVAGRLAQLELALLSAAFCREYGARVTGVPDSPGEGAGLVLRSTRHPLLVERARLGELEEVVPIDVRLGGEFDLLVITGPNTGGKTLALKTVGVAAWCARHGLPVCCESGSRVPLYEDLVVDIGDEQELSQSLSTFASHLVRIRVGLERAGPRVLVLLDELGGGTDPDEGTALGDAILEHLLQRGVPTLATTHLGKLKEFAFRHARAENASVEFDVETLAPRYRLLIGTPGESNALVIARRYGLDPDLVARAGERLERHDREVLELMGQMRGAAEHAERLRGQAETRLAELERQGAGMREQEQELARRGDQLEAEAQRGLEERVRDARRRLERAFDLLAQVPAPAAGQLREVLEGIDDDLTGASLTERRRAFLDGLKKGHFVYVPRFKKRCVVKKVDRGRGEVTVQLGSMPMRVPFDEVTWYEAI